VPQKISKLVSDFNSKIEALEAKKGFRERTTIHDLIRFIFERPGNFIIIIFMFALYLAMIMGAMKYRIYLRKKVKHTE